MAASSNARPSIAVRLASQNLAADTAGRSSGARPGPAPALPGSVVRALTGGRQVLLIATVLLLFALPTSFGLVPVAHAALPGAPQAGFHPAIASHPAPIVAGHASALSAPLPGSDPKLLPAIDGPKFANQFFSAQSAHPTDWAKLASEYHGGTIQTPPPAAPHPAAASIPTGTVFGYVYNSTGPLQGVSVQAYSASGTSTCPAKTCSVVFTTSNGSFLVTAPVGADYLAFTASWYLENITYVQVLQGRTTYLNYTVYMVQDAIAVGTVESNATGHRTLAGVTVNAVARDQSQICQPGTTTGSNGYFKIALCPMPSTITFSPPFGYLSTFRYANATPGETVNFGVVYLENEMTVRASLYDAVTRAPIPSGTCGVFYSQCNSITVCASATNVCLTQGVAVGSSAVAALGPKGNDYVKALATGYIENDQPIGYINTTTNVGAIYMVPMGSISISISVTHNSTALPPLAQGLWTATACNMNGLQAATVTVNAATYTVNMSQTSCVGACAPPSTAFVTFPALPLRNDVTTAPDTAGSCGGPPTWPIPSSLPVWGNETYVNVTPDMVTTGVYANLTPGDYVYGVALVQQVGLPPVAPLGGFTATGTSTDNPTLTAYGYNSLLSGWGCSPQPHNASTFCAAVPPGPGEIRISSLTQNYSDNFTWGSVPYFCCYRGYEPMSLSQFTGGAPATHGFTSINLTKIGYLHGRVLQGGTNLGVFFGTVKVSAAGNHPQLPSFDGAVYLNGSFSSQAPLGWVSITASASGFAPNTVWAFVNGSNTNIGNISLTPLATIQGQIIDPTGHGIYSANVKYCRVDVPTSCSVLGAGLSSSDGVFNGTVIGGWLPWTTYEIQVSAAGYTSDWTWANATAGASTVMDPVTLYPVGTNGTVGAAAVHRSAGHSSAAGVWIDGTLLDGIHYTGVQAGGIQACPIDGSPCTGITDGSNSQGYFNGSVAPGLYNITVSSPGYQPLSQGFNASYASYVHIGQLLMTPLPWVQGNANITPWGLISVRHGAGWVRIALVPGSSAFACSTSSSVCGNAVHVSSQGFFQIQTAGGVYNHVQITPFGGTVGPSSNGGFGSNLTVFNSTAVVTNLTMNITLAVYTTVSGFVYDGSTVGPNGVSPWVPQRWTPVAIATFGPNHITAAYTTNGGGWYEFFVPAGPTLVATSAGGNPEASIAANETFNFTGGLSNAIGSVSAKMPQMNLTHYGWLNVQVDGTVNRTGAAYVGISMSVNDPLNGTQTSNGQTNLGGFANLTAPPGWAQVLIGPGGDYNQTTFKTHINASKPTYYNGTSVLELTPVLIPEWGWVRSLAVNDTANPDLPTIIDAANGLPLPFALVTVTSQMPGLSGSSLSSNWMGQFLSDAPIGIRDSIQVVHYDYLNNYTQVNIATGQTVVKPTINMTGVGILAGTVVQFPGYVPIPFATVQTCPFNATGFSNCFTTTTNSTGQFWVASFPGLVTVTTSANGFVSNTTTIARSCADCWNRIPSIVLSEYAYVFGYVRELPTGLPINGALVYACSPLGNPVGLCGFQVTTDVNGKFLLGVPSGRYVLDATAVDHNSSYLPVFLRAGETLPVGIMFLKQYGSLTGVVLSSTTYLPVFNASVFGCPNWAGNPCTQTSYTDASGRYTISGPPGPYTIAVLANGYADAYAGATLVSGARTSSGPLFVTPLGAAIFYLVGGRVVNATDPSVGVSGAIVSADVNGTPAFSTRTDANGGFVMNVLYGSYVLAVSSPGYQPVNQKLVVHGAVSGIIVPLSIMTYLVSGIVSDGLTLSLLSDVEIADQGISILAVTDLNGYYSFALANGTHPLLATYVGASSVSYGSVWFSVTVNGASVYYPLALLPPSVMIHGNVVDAIAGTPLAGATVHVVGMTTDGVPVSQDVSSNPGGGFTITLPVGTYNATTGYTGYHSKTVAFSVTAAGQTVPLALSPIATPTTGVAASGSNALYVLIAALGVLVGALALLSLWVVTGRRKRSKAPAGARPSGTTAPRAAPARKR